LESPTTSKWIQSLSDSFPVEFAPLQWAVRHRHQHLRSVLDWRPQALARTASRMVPTDSCPAWEEIPKPSLAVHQRSLSKSFSTGIQLCKDSTRGMAIVGKELVAIVIFASKSVPLQRGLKESGELHPSSVSLCLSLSVDNKLTVRERDETRWRLCGESHTVRECCHRSNKDLL